MAVLIGIMNIVNYSSVVTESDTILDILSGPNAPFGEKHKKEILTKKACKKLVILTSLFITVSLLRVLPSPQRFCR